MSEEFTKYFQEYCDEVHQLMGSFLFWKTLNEKTIEDGEFLSKLNDTPLSWILIRHSLLVSTFMALGRLFDSDSRTFSANFLLSFCKAEIEIFSKEQLRERKILSSNGYEPDWLDQWIENVEEPLLSDFDRLRGELRAKTNTFNDRYRPIRHKIIAHKERDFVDNEDELWEQTNKQEFEELVYFFRIMENSIRNTYDNGRKLELQCDDLDTSFYTKDYELLYRIIKNE